MQKPPLDDENGGNGSGDGDDDDEDDDGGDGFGGGDQFDLQTKFISVCQHSDEDEQVPFKILPSSG